MLQDQSQTITNRVWAVLVVLEFEGVVTRHSADNCVTDPFKKFSTFEFDRFSHLQWEFLKLIFFVDHTAEHHVHL